MAFIDTRDIEPREVFPGFHVRFVHSATMTFAHWEIEAGAALPEHAHVHEQVVNVLEGEFELTIGSDTRVLGPGAVAIIPSDALTQDAPSPRAGSSTLSIRFARTTGDREYRR